jgi:hypothetical protein
MQVEHSPILAPIQTLLAGVEDPDQNRLGSRRWKPAVSNLDPDEDDDCIKDNP